jgi:hypothetical protein
MRRHSALGLTSSPSRDRSLPRRCPMHATTPRTAAPPPHAPCTTPRDARTAHHAPRTTHHAPYPTCANPPAHAPLLAPTTREQLAKAHEARANGAAERLHVTSSSVEAVQEQLVVAHERIASLALEVDVSRARERRALDDAAAARDEKAVLEASVNGSKARADALHSKVHVAREARLHAVATAEKRESELKSLRTELAQTQARLAEALERQIRASGIRA